MFKKSYLTSMLLIAMLILAACGTAEEDKGTTKDSSSGQDSTQEIESNETEIDEEDGLEEDEDNEQDTDAGTEKEEDEVNGSNTEQNQEDNKASNHKEDQTNAEQVASDEQDFAIDVLPAYTLTSEEPGRDSLFLTEDGNVFMRIETAPFDQESYDYFDENTVSLFESIKADGADITDATTLPQSGKDALGYTVTTNESIVTGFVFEKDDLIVRLTIFDTLDAEYFNDFLKMGETITNK